MKKTTKAETNSKSFITLSGKSASGWGGLIICSFVLFFFLGTLVGRGSITVDLGQKKLSKEINQYAESLNTIASENVEIIDDTPDLVFYENLQKKENAKIEIEQSRSKKRAKKTKKVIKKKTIIKKPALVATAEIEPKKVKIKKETKTKTKTTNTKDTDVYKYSIQIASFKGLADAKKTVSKFKQKGYSAYYVKAVVRNHEIWYRVRIGAFKDRIDAKTTLARLEKNKIDGFLVTR